MRKKNQGQAVLEFSILTFFIGVPLLFGLCLALAHSYLDTAALADAFLSARAELYGNESHHCQVAKFWTNETALYKVKKSCSRNAQATVEVQLKNWPGYHDKSDTFFSFSRKINLKSERPL
jgi:hypothetical protein